MSIWCRWVAFGLVRISVSSLTGGLRWYEYGEKRPVLRSLRAPTGGERSRILLCNGVHMLVLFSLNLDGYYGKSSTSITEILVGFEGIYTQVWSRPIQNPCYHDGNARYTASHILCNPRFLSISTVLGPIRGEVGSKEVRPFVLCHRTTASGQTSSRLPPALPRPSV